jgi:hypothetical protein
MGPTWQSIVPELVPRSDLKSAVALNSLGINIARAIGPAAGGLLLASFGAAATYGARRAELCVRDRGAAVVEAPGGGRQRAVRALSSAPSARACATRAPAKELHVVLLRAAVFFLFASSVWALLPLVARQMLGGTPASTASCSAPWARAPSWRAGAAAAAARPARCRRLCCWPRCSRRGDGGLVFAPPQWLAVLLLLVLGVGWIIALTTLNGVAQSILPNWVRGRGLAVYLTVFNGAMAAGSLGWGLVAQQIGVPATLVVGAVGLVVMGLRVPPRQAARRRGRPAGLEPLARAAAGRAGGARPRAGDGPGRVPHPQGRPAGLPAGDAEAVAGAPPRRRLRLGHHRAHGATRSG